MSRTSKKNAFFQITAEEARLLWARAHLRGNQFRMMLGFTLFCGLPLKQIVSLRVADVRAHLVLLRKRLVVKEVCEFANALEEYLKRNAYRLGEGFAFPEYHGVSKHVTPATATAMFHRFRQLIAQEFPQFLEKITRPSFSCSACKTRDTMTYGEVSRCDACGHESEQIKMVPRHRVTWQSARGWYNTLRVETNASG